MTFYASPSCNSWEFNGKEKFDCLDSRNEDNVFVLQAHAASVTALEFDTNGKYFAAGSLDSAASIWSLPDMVCRRTVFAGETKHLYGVQFSHDSELLAINSKEGIDVVSIRVVRHRGGY